MGSPGGAATRHQPNQPYTPQVRNTTPKTNPRSHSKAEQGAVFFGPSSAYLKTEAPLGASGTISYSMPYPPCLTVPAALERLPPSRPAPTPASRPPPPRSAGSGSWPPAAGTCQRATGPARPGRRRARRRPPGGAAGGRGRARAAGRPAPFGLATRAFASPERRPASPAANRPASPDTHPASPQYVSPATRTFSFATR